MNSTEWFGILVGCAWAASLVGGSSWAAALSFTYIHHTWSRTLGLTRQLADHTSGVSFGPASHDRNKQPFCFLIVLLHLRAEHLSPSAMCFHHIACRTNLFTDLTPQLCGSARRGFCYASFLHLALLVESTVPHSISASLSPLLYEFIQVPLQDLEWECVEMW